MLCCRRGRRQHRGYMPATPDRHLRVAVSSARISPIDHLVNGGAIENPVIALSEQSQIGRLDFELRTPRADTFGIRAMTSGAILHVFRPTALSVL